MWAYVDKPRAWDAWDIDESYPDAGFEITEVDSIEEVEPGPLRGAVRVTRTWRSSVIVQTYRLLSGSKQLDIVTDIEWHEGMMLLRTNFPTSIHTHEAVGETIYGVHRRSTHRNTQFERARFEAGAHRFIDLSEPDYGVALLNDGKYGHSVLGNTLGISLVRGPIYPDPFADEGAHYFSYALLPHNGDWVAGGVVRAAQEFNAPILAVTGKADAKDVPLIETSGLEIGFSAMKKAHDREGIVLRVYEPHGASGTTTLTFSKPVQVATFVNILEVDEAEEVQVNDNTITLDIRPWQLISLYLEL